MKRSTIIKRVRKAGTGGLSLRRLGAKDDAIYALVSELVNEGVLIRYDSKFHNAMYVRMPLSTDNLEQWRNN